MSAQDLHPSPDAVDLYPVEIQYWQAVGSASPQECVLLSAGIEPRLIAELRDLQLADQVSFDDMLSNGAGADFDGSVDLGVQQSLVDGRGVALTAALRNGELKSVGGSTSSCRLGLPDFVIWAVAKQWLLPSWMRAFAPSAEAETLLRKSMRVAARQQAASRSHSKRRATSQRDEILARLAKDVGAEHPAYSKSAVAEEVRQRAAKQGIHLALNSVRNILHGLRPADNQG